MFRLLVDFPQQVIDAVEIGSKINVPIMGKSIRNVIVTGLGGSAIGGDVLRAFSAENIRVPFLVNRHYFLPAFVDESTLVIVASYSGNTEETLAVYKDAMRRRAQIVCISSNGTLEKLARKNRHPLITIPKGYPPRVALGFSFFPMLMLLAELKLIPSPERQIKETIELLQERSKMYAQDSELENHALSLAKQLVGKLPIIYSSADRFDVVNVRCSFIRIFRAIVT